MGVEEMEYRFTNPTEKEGGVTEPAQRLAERGVEEGKRLGYALRSRALRSFDRKREELISRLQSLSERVERDMPAQGDGNPEARFITDAARYTRGLASRIERYDAQELIDEVAERVQQRPALFIAGGITLGFLLARVLRD